MGIPLLTFNSQEKCQEEEDSEAQEAPTQAPAQTQSGGGMMSGLAGTLMQGMAFGAGSEIAHSTIRSMMGGGHTQEVQQQAPQQQNMCQNENNNFVECLKFNQNDIGGCQNYLDLLKSCEQRYSS